MECYACSHDATQECPRCGALYCDDHGDALCARCMDPAQALPSYRVYRGSLVALLVASVFAVWMLVRPGDGAGLDGPPPALAGGVAETPVATETATPTPEATPTPTATEDADDEGAGDEGGAADDDPETEPDEAETPTPTPEAPEPQQYVVQAGDTMLGIAQAFAPPGTDVNAFADRIAAENGLSDISQLSIGQTLVIPAE